MLLLSHNSHLSDCNIVEEKCTGELIGHGRLLSVFLYMCGKGFWECLEDLPAGHKLTDLGFIVHNIEML